MSKKHSADRSEKPPEKNALPLSRRKLLNIIPVSTVGAITLSGTVAGESDSADNKSEQSKTPSRGKTRAEKAAEAGYEWDESWVNEDMIGESYVEKRSNSGLEVDFSKSQTNCLDLVASIGGIDVGIISCWSPCDVETTVTAFGQSATRYLTCSNACESVSLNAGAAYIDLKYCVDWSNQTLSVEGSGCVWSITHWSCDSIDATYSY